MAAKKKTAKEAWESILRAAEEAEIERALGETEAEVDEGLRAHGLDPGAVREEGAALAARLLAQRKRMIEAHEEMAKDVARTKARAARYLGIPRAELLARLLAAKADPRFQKPVTFMFRNHKLEEATEEQLREMLRDVDALAEKAEKDEEKK